MRTRKKFIIEYELKKQLLFKSLPLIKRYLLDSRKNLKANSLMHMIYSDALKSIRDIYHYESIEYKDAFFLCMALGRYNVSIKNDENVLNETIQNIRNQKLWDENKVDLNMSVFFSYIFFNELYKDINIDMTMVSRKGDNIKEAYTALRKKIISDWESNIQSQEKSAMVFEETNSTKKRRRRSNMKLTTYNDTEEGIE